MTIIEVPDLETLAGINTHGWPRRHVDIVQLIALGMSNEEIAKRLHISTHTVKSHMAKMTDRYMARNRAHLVFIAMRAGVFR